MEFKQNTLEHIKTSFKVVKAKELPAGQFEAVLSTADLDRHGEVVSIKGLAIPKDQVIKMYYNHETNGASLPIGQWDKIWKSKDGKLMGRGKIDLLDDFEVKIDKKIKLGTLDSISIGFYPQEFDGESSTWTKSTLVEASVVAEPANVNARITSKELGFTEAEFNKSLVVKLADELFVGEEGKPAKEVVQDPATYDLKPPEQSEPAIDQNSEEAIEDGDSITELKAAFEELKSKFGALEAAVKASDEEPAMKTLLIKARTAGKEVDKKAEELNTVLRVKLKES